MLTVVAPHYGEFQMSSPGPFLPTYKALRFQYIALSITKQCPVDMGALVPMLHIQAYDVGSTSPNGHGIHVIGVYTQPHWIASPHVLLPMVNQLI
jgi:hypothetical protein